MANGDVQIGPLINIGVAVALDLIAWMRERHDAQMPTDADVVARAKAKVQALQNEGQAALDEFTDEPLP